ncbi:hypothetical protein ACQJBY_029705 [Aegilops geniculata]
MDGDRRMPAAAAASAASVLGNDDLLREILLRLGFPTCLVHAALVSKRWLLHASDPAFLRRFRERNPPRLLGFCLRFSGRYRFVPFPPQPPELAAPIRRATSSCGAAFARRILPINHCRNGRLIIEFFDDDRSDYSLAPLLAGEAAAVLPTTPLPHLDWDTTQGRLVEMFLPEDGDRNGITLLYLWAVRRKVYAELYVLGSGGWGVPATATEIELSFDAHFLEILPPIHGKVFVVTDSRYALGLDLAAASFFTLELPVGVRHNYKLSCAEDSGLYLVSADRFQLSVWLHPMSGDGNGAGWLLVDTFCVREAEACAHFVRDRWIPPGNYLDVAAVGDNAEFVFLDHTASGTLFYVHLRSRVVEKVHKRVPEKCYVPHQIALSPIVMIWPPVFPAREIGHDQEE